MRLRSLRWLSKEFELLPRKTSPLSKKNDPKGPEEIRFLGLFLFGFMMKTRFGGRLGACFAGFLFVFGEILEARFGIMAMAKMAGQTTVLFGTITWYLREMAFNSKNRQRNLN